MPALYTTRLTCKCVCLTSFNAAKVLGAFLRGRTATQCSEKGSQKVLGRVLGKGSQKGSETGA